jgi:hypothetical protein
MAIPRYPITIDGESTDIGAAAELVAALDVLQGHHDRLVLEQLRPHLAAILAGPQGFLATLRVLSAEDQTYLIDALGPALPAIVKDARALRDILASLAEPAVEERLLNTLGAGGLNALIGSAEELAEVLEWIYGDCDRLALDLLGDDALRRLCLGGYELSLVLHALDEDRQQELLTMLGWQFVLSLVQDRRDLAYLVRALPAEMSQRLLSHLADDRLRSLVRDDRDRRYLAPYLEDGEAAYLDQRLASRPGVHHHAQ